MKYFRIASVGVLVLLLSTCLRTGPKHFRLYKVTEEAGGGGDSAISPDGQSFITSIRTNGVWNLWMYDMRGRQWQQLTNGTSDSFEGQWSPDGKKIVFTSTRAGNKDVFVLDRKTGQTLQLTNDPEDDEYPTFSPDGTEINYTGGKWKQRRFYVVSAQGGERRAVNPLPGQAGACSFHPSGHFLICHAYDSGSGNVYLYPVSGGEPLRLTNGNFWDYKPTLSPDGKWMAFSRSEREGPSAVWFMNYPVGEAFPLTLSENDDRWPTWSADGARLLFHRLVDRGTGIRLYDRHRHEFKVLVGAEELPGAASLDRAGHRLAYIATRQQRQELRVKELATGRTFTIPLPGDADFPRWSPDGSRIALTLRTRERWDVATVNADGSGLSVWSAPLAGVRSIHSPIDWSPDGRRIVFHASTQPFEANLYMVETSTGRLVNLTRDHWFSEAPSFSPDGQEITFMSTRGGNWTWGLFRLSLRQGHYQTVSDPDYVEKNFPGIAGDGSMVWSTYQADVEYLMERSRAGAINLLKEAGEGARWPSYTSDGNFILYTVVEHHVEYWMADNLDAPDSPLQVSHPHASSVAAAACPNRPRHTAAAGQPELSPVQMFHR